MYTTTVGGPATTTSRRVTRGVTVAALTTILIAGLAGCQTGSPIQGADTLQNARVVVPQNVDTRMSADRIERELSVEPFNAAAAQLRALQKQYAGMPADRIERAIEDYVAAMRATDHGASRDRTGESAGRPPRAAHAACDRTGEPAGRPPRRSRRVKSRRPALRQTKTTRAGRSGDRPALVVCTDDALRGGDDSLNPCDAPTTRPSPGTETTTRRSRSAPIRSRRPASPVAGRDS